MKKIQDLLETLKCNQALSDSDCSLLLAGFVEGSVTEKDFKEILCAIPLKPLRASEIKGFSKYLRSQMLALPKEIGKGALDLCGTGGDGKGLFNVSSAVSIVLASMGHPVVKHGNRAQSGKSGSADVMKALGVFIPENAIEAEEFFKRFHFTFLHAPHYHPVFSKIAPLRASLGVRTIFNFLGPLLNPASPEFQMVGVPFSQALDPMAEALASLGVTRSLLVTSEDGFDELSPFVPNEIRKITGHAISKDQVHGAQWGVLPLHSRDAGKISSVEESAELIEEIFSSGGLSEGSEWVLLNSAAALWMKSGFNDPRVSVEKVRDALTLKEPFRFLEKLRQGSEELR